MAAIALRRGRPVEPRERARAAAARAWPLTRAPHPRAHSRGPAHPRAVPRLRAALERGVPGRVRPRRGAAARGNAYRRAGRASAQAAIRSLVTGVGDLQAWKATVITQNALPLNALSKLLVTVSQVPAPMRRVCVNDTVWWPRACPDAARVRDSDSVAACVLSRAALRDSLLLWVLYHVRGNTLWVLMSHAAFSNHARRAAQITRAKTDLVSTMAAALQVTRLFAHDLVHDEQIRRLDAITLRRASYAAAAARRGRCRPGSMVTLIMACGGGGAASATWRSSWRSSRRGSCALR